MTNRSDRVLRGGGWYSVAQVLRSGYRDYGSPGGRDNIIGFRLVRTPVSLDSGTIDHLDKAEIARSVAKVQSALDGLKKLLK